MKEIWKVIEGFPNYEISNLGKVKSLNYGRTGKAKILKDWKMKNGYKLVKLHSNKKNKYFLVHRLVAKAFLSNIKNKNYVNHKNGIRDDNRLCNLEWVTSSENALHSFRELGRIPPHLGLCGSKSPHSIKIKQFTKCGNLIKIWGSAVEASDKLLILKTSINNNLKGLSKSAGGFIWKYY